MTRRTHARKRLGQNFLVDDRAATKIVDALDPRPTDAVLEIGPGRGALTGRLIERAQRVAAVELDLELAQALRRRFPESALVLLTGDVLQLEPTRVLDALDRPRDARLLLVGNLPYYISKPVAMKVVADRRRVERAVLMFQREVAQRLTARPATRSYGPLTVLCGAAFCIERLFDLGGQAFRPRPQVDSTVTRWTRRSESPLDRGLETPLRRCLAAAFGRRRQTLRNNLRAALDSEARAEELLQAAGVAGRLRAEALAPEQFLRLAEAWDEYAPL